MFYFFVRVAVYMLALLLTFVLLPGLHLNLNPLNQIPAAELAQVQRDLA